MKNILLLGASRAGKTTFTRMLNNKYQVICEDAMLVAYKETINEDTSLTPHEVGQIKEYKEFIIKVFNKYIKYNKDLKYVLDTVDILPSHAYRFDKTNTIIIVLGYPNAKAEEVVLMQRKYDNEDDWTLKLSDEKLLENANFWIKKSKEYEQECKDLNIKFVDTSKNRQKVLENLLEWLEQQD